MEEEEEEEEVEEEEHEDADHEDDLETGKAQDAHNQL